MKKTNCALYVYLSNPTISPEEAWSISQRHEPIDHDGHDSAPVASGARRTVSHTANAGHVSVCDGDCFSCCCVFVTMRNLVENYDVAPDILMAFKQRFMK